MLRITYRHLLSAFIIFFVAGFIALFVARAQTCPNLLPGDLFKVQGHSAVYLLNVEKKRLYFPHANVYYTWYKDFSTVKTIPNHCVDSYPAPTTPPYGMNYKPGSRLVKLQISPTVYAVLPGNKLFKIESEAVARSLYGPNWASLVADVPEVYWSNFIGIDNSAPPIFASQNPTNVNSPLGTNLEAMARWSATFPIIDSFKMTEGWLVNFETDKPLNVDANGWLKSMPKDTQSVDTFIHGHNEGNFPSGEYVVLYDGEGTIEYTGDAAKNEALSKPGRHVIDVKATKGGGIVLQITATDPKKTGNYIKNIRVIQPGGRCGGDPLSYAAKANDCPQGNFRSFEQDYDKNILHPQFLQNISAFSTIRFMGFLGTMYNPVGKWSERATLSSAFWGDSQGKTAPWELVLDMANAVDADAWLNIPYHGDDDYVLQAARLAKQRLEPQRKVILEYTNEVWNTIMPYEKGGAWIQQQAEALWPRSNDDGFNKRLSWYGKRSVEICRIWKQELGAGRVKCTMGGQSGWDFISEQMLDCPVWVANGGKRCADEMDSLAVAPYFGAPYDTKGVEKLRKWMKESDGGFKSFFDDLEGPSGTLQDVKKTMQGNLQVAKQRGLPLIAYEGGQHLLLSYEVNDLPQYEDVHNFLAAVNRHPRMKQAYLKYFQNWKEAGGQLFVHCCAIAASPSIYGYWGLKETQQEERSKAPKFDAAMEFITASVLLALNPSGVLSVLQAAEESQKAPTITLLGPQRNKKLPIRSSEKIAWKATNVKDNYWLVLNIENDEADLLGRIEVLSGDRIQQGSYIWFIRDVTLDDIVDRIREGRYRITATLYDGEVCLWHGCNVTNPGKKIAHSTSNYFSITPAKPPIKLLLAPRKGEVLKVGNKKLIKWKANVSHPNIISINLYRQPWTEAISVGNGIYVIAERIANRQTFHWTVDQKIPPGKYILQVYDKISGESDKSGIFNISASPASLSR